MIFHCIPVSAIDANPSQLVNCAAECDDVRQLKNAVIWIYQLDNKWEKRAFCSHKHALTCMLPNLLNNA